MQVILLEELQNLGDLGDEVKVRAGYARNYLIPQGKAVIASEENRKKFEARRLELERLHAEALSAAQARAVTLDGASVRIMRKAGEDGNNLFSTISKIYGGDTFVQATIAALDSVTDVRSIAAPSLVVQNNAQATITVGDQIPVQSSSISTGVGRPEWSQISSVSETTA